MAWDYSKESSNRVDIRADFTGAVKDISIALAKCVPFLATLEMYHDKKSIISANAILEVAKQKIQDLQDNLDIK